MYQLVERIRQLSVAYRIRDDKGAGQTLAELLKNLSLEQTVQVARAFSYFSHLANIAEDHHTFAAASFTSAAARRSVVRWRRAGAAAGEAFRPSASPDCWGRRMCRPC